MPSIPNAQIQKAMLTIEQALRNYNSKLVNEILGDQRFREATASGNFAEFINTAQSVELHSDPDWVEFTKYGTDYTTALDKGVAPGPSVGLDKAIYDWLAYKKYGLAWETEKQRKRLATSISDRIQALGSYKYRNANAQTTTIADALGKSYPVLMEGLNQATFETLDMKIKQMTDNANT